MKDTVEDLKNYSMRKSGPKLNEYIWLQVSKAVLPTLGSTGTQLEVVQEALKHENSQLFATSIKPKDCLKPLECHVIIESANCQKLDEIEAMSKNEIGEHPYLENMVKTSIDDFQLFNKKDSEAHEGDLSFKEPLNNTVIVEQGTRKDSEGSIKYKIIMDYVEKFLGDPNNILGYILRHYKTRLLMKYDKFLARPAEKLDPLKILHMKEELTAEIKSFANFLTEEVLDYFSLKSITKANSMRKISVPSDMSPVRLRSDSRMPTWESTNDSGSFGTRINKFFIYGFVLSVLFDPETYGVVFGLMRCGEREDENVFLANLWKLSDYGPDAFGVDPLFSLNPNLIEKILEKPSEIITDPNQISFFCSEFSQDEENKDEHPHRGPKKINFLNLSGHLTSSIGKFLDQCPKGHSKGIHSLSKLLKEPKAKQEANPPFENTIKMLSFLPFTRSPYHKFKLLLDVSESIHKEIIDFYQKYTGKPPIYLPGEDQLIAILLYIITNCQVPSILTHCQMITAFLPETVIFRYSGYFINQVIQCIDTIYKITPPESEDIFLNVEEDPIPIRKEILFFQESVKNSIYTTLQAIKSKEATRIITKNETGAFDRLSSSFQGSPRKFSDHL